MAEITNPTGWSADSAAARAALRARCLKAREELAADHIAALGEALCRRLHAHFSAPPAASIGFCWPVRGEADIRPAALDWLARGATLALPRIVSAEKRLDFHVWQPGDAMAAGPFGIPEPAATAPPLRPGCLLLPMVGFDAEGFRLGYGAGYFDRTLADWQPRPLLIGVAFELARLDSVLPQPHDVPMDWIATEAGVFRAARQP